MTSATHIPVMLERCVEILGPALGRPGAVVLDATLGLGGHSEAFLRRFPEARLIGLDRDPQALEASGRRLAPFGERAALVHAVYDEIPDVLERLGVAELSGTLFDLGVSSLQLDMRMDSSRGITAAEIVNTYPAADIARILRDYGEERFARRIAENIVAEREKEPFTTTARLSELVRDSIPAATRRTGGHPAKRTFQALRIAVNDELPVLERALPAAVAATGLGGRIAVLSYHSLEDRLVKRVFAKASESAAPPGLPVVPEQYQPKFRLLTRGAEPPTDAEIAENPRAASAKLRAAERVREG